MTATRTQDEIAGRVRGIAGDDRDWSRRAILVSALDAQHAPDFVSDVAARHWVPAQDIWGDAQNLYLVALAKILSHRGIPASRNPGKLAEYAWLLGRDDVVAAIDQAPYVRYGAPKVHVFATGFGLHWPTERGLARMVQGMPCTPRCAMGCEAK